MRLIVFDGPALARAIGQSGIDALSAADKIERMAAEE